MAPFFVRTRGQQLATNPLALNKSIGDEISRDIGHLLVLLENLVLNLPARVFGLPVVQVSPGNECILWEATPAARIGCNLEH